MPKVDFYAHVRDNGAHFAPWALDAMINCLSAEEMKRLIRLPAFLGWPENNRGIVYEALGKKSSHGLSTVPSHR